MTEGLREIAPFYCPRCGGLMRKPMGSNLYWHNDNNHPRCSITNIVGSALETEKRNDPPSEPVVRLRKKDK